MEDFIVDECTSLKYELIGDYYLLAGEDDPVPIPIGIWGQRHRDYLKTHKEGITEELKVADQMTWIAAMNGINTRVTEIVNKALIFVCVNSERK